MLPRLRGLVINDPGLVTKLFIFTRLVCPGLLLLDLSFSKVQSDDVFPSIADFLSQGQLGLRKLRVNDGYEGGTTNDSMRRRIGSLYFLLLNIPTTSRTVVVITWSSMFLDF